MGTVFSLKLGTQHLVVEVPDAWVLCTRSGCIKKRHGQRNNRERAGAPQPCLGIS